MKAPGCIAIVLLLLDFTSGYSQKNYAFDYVFEYQLEHTEEDGKKHTHNHYRFISSTDSSYMLLVSEREDEVGMKLVLDNGKFYHGTIARDEFFVEAISLKCPLTGTNTGKQRMKDFRLVTKSDTIINTQRFGHFILQPVSEKKFKNNEIGAEHYIMDNSLYLNFPSLPAYDTAYRFWKENKNIPNGFLKECILRDSNGRVTGHLRFVQYIKLTKYIIIDNNCK